MNDRKDRAEEKTGHVGPKNLGTVYFWKRQRFRRLIRGNFNDILENNALAKNPVSYKLFSGVGKLFYLEWLTVKFN